jgi:hypothetical protein
VCAATSLRRRHCELPKLIIDFELIDENGPAVTFGTPFQTEVAYWSVRDFVAQSKGPR